MARIRPLALLVMAACLLGGGSATAGSPASIRGVFERALTAEQFCEVEFLRHLGWRFETDPKVTALTVHGGRVGHFEDLAAAHAAGCLRVRVPAGFDVSRARASADRLVALVDSIPSRLAYRHKLSAPLRRAARRLSDMTEAGRYAFPEIFDLFHSPFYRVAMPLTEWTLRGPVKKEKMWFATRSPALAMEAFFRLGATAECYVGQLMAQYATQYELLGRDWFDRVFTAQEIVVGRPNDVIKTPLMKNMEFEVPYEWRALILEKEHQFKDPVLTLAPHGPAAFTGLGGVVLNQDDDCFTQDNVLILSVTGRALDELVKGGGIEYFNRETARLWECGNKGKDGMIDVAGLFNIGGLSAEVEKMVDEALARPMFSEIQVYVHPDGIVPLAFTVKKFVERTDTPVTLRINRNGLDNEFYQRYRRAFVEGCLALRKRASVASPEIADN